jgi:hypothetical protein
MAQLLWSFNGLPTRMHVTSEVVVELADLGAIGVSRT